MNGGRDYWDSAVVLSSAAQKYHSTASVISPYDDNALALTIFVYCRNQENTVSDTLATIAETMRVVDKPYEVVVVDDASKDASSQRVREFIGNHPQMNIVLCTGKIHKGLVRSYIDAAFIGRGQYYRLVRADDNEPMETMVDIFRTLGDADIILPYSISKEDAGLSVMQSLCRGIMNMLSGQYINDYNSSQIHLRFNVMRWHPGTRGSAFHADLLCRLLALGFTYKQVPTRNIPRRDGLQGGFSDLVSLLHVIMRMALRKISDVMHKNS